MSSPEFAEMMAFARIEPFGSGVEDLRAGVVASTMANIYRDRKARPEPFGELDLIPWNDSHRSEVEVAKPDAIYLEDADAMSALIEASIFGETPHGNS